MTKGEKISRALHGHIVSEETRKKQSLAKKNTGYNIRIVARNNFGLRLSMEARQKISSKLMGHPMSQETKDKISQANKGRIFSEEHRAKIAQANRERSKIPISEETRRNMSVAKHKRDAECGGVNKGRIFSEAWKKNISLGHKGIKYSKERNEAIRQARLGTKWIDGHWVKPQ
jgi:hypothetical protein